MIFEREPRVIGRSAKRPTRNPRGRSRWATLMVGGLCLAACGDGSTPATDGTGGGAGADPVAIELILTRPYYVPAGFVEAMLEKHAIELIVDLQPNDDILTRLQARKDAGQPLPDLIGAEDSFLMPAFAEAGFVGDHSAFREQFAVEAPEVYEQLWDEVWTETEGTGVSITANFDVFHYDVEWFEEAGVTAPFGSFDDVLDGMRALKATRPGSVPLAVQARAGSGVTTLKTMLAGTGTPFDGAAPDLASAGGLYTCNWWVTAAREGLTPPDAAAWGEDEARASFAAGDAGLLLDGFSAAGDLREVEGFDSPDQWHSTPSPVTGGPAGTDGVAWSAARTWGIVEGTEHPYEAGLVIREIASTRWLLAQAAEGGVPARSQAMMDSPELLEIWPFFDEDLKAAYRAAEPQAAGGNADVVEAILEEFFAEIVSGQSTDCDDLVARYQPRLDAAS